MKSTLKKLIVNIVNNDILWFFIKPIAKFGFLAFYSRRRPSNIISHENDPYLAIFHKNEVLHGPFKGMKYPSVSSVGSSFYPKLIGSYEKELHEIINECLHEDYTEIIDIGCAEGYYAIGLGLKLPRANIYAYDTDATARHLCNQMAELNHVEDRVVVRQTCTADELEKFKFNGHALIICDCEGYEANLFTRANVRNLSNCDLIIETHDFVDLAISGNLCNLFRDSHDIQVIKSIDDIEKVKTYAYEETNSLRLEEKMKLYRECRPTIMEWLICTPKRA